MFDFITVVGSIIDAIVSEFTVRFFLDLSSTAKYFFIIYINLLNVLFFFLPQADNQQKVTIHLDFHFFYHIFDPEKKN